MGVVMVNVFVVCVLGKVKYSMWLLSKNVCG